MYWETKREPNGYSKFDQMCIAKQDAVIIPDEKQNLYEPVQEEASTE